MPPVRNGLTEPQNTVVVAQTEADYTLALVRGVHGQPDVGLASLAALAGTETQAVTDTRAEAMRTAIAAHMLSVATSTVAGEHLAADTATRTTLLAIPAAVDLATCIVLVNGLHAARAHGAVAGVHFHDDAVVAAATITTNPPTTLAQCRTNLNDGLAYWAAHFALGITSAEALATVGAVGRQVTYAGGSITPPVAMSASGTIDHTAGTQFDLDPSGGAIAAALPAEAPIGTVILINDPLGGFAAHNVTMSVSGGGTINGSANGTADAWHVLATAFEGRVYRKVAATAWYSPQ